MTDSIHLTAWAVQSKVPDACPLCKTEHPLFEYTVSTDPSASDPSRELQGYCYLRCGQQLLATMGELTLARWAGQAAPKPDEKTGTE